MNRGEWGIAFQLGVGFDISGFSTLSLVFHKPSGTTLTVTFPDVTAPLVAGEEAPAGEYFEYITKDGDIDEEGTWTVCGIYVDGLKRLVSDHSSFLVTPGCD